MGRRADTLIVRPTQAYEDVAVTLRSSEITRPSWLTLAQVHQVRPTGPRPQPPPLHPGQQAHTPPFFSEFLKQTSPFDKKKWFTWTFAEKRA